MSQSAPFSKYYQYCNPSDTLASPNRITDAKKIFAHLQINTYLCTGTSPDGGIGRRVGLKHRWGNPCRFDPGSGY